MAITISQEPEGIYPAYNDSFIKFSSDLVNNNRAKITVYPVLTFPNVFVIYPDADGNYLFNLKEAVKVLFNVNGFEDENFDTSVFWKSITGLYLYQQIDIEVFSDISDESTTEYYEFFKAVKQISEAIYSNTVQLLTYTPDGVNHTLTYFEGFPFHFDIQKVLIDAEIVVKSLNTGNDTGIMTATNSESFRVIIDRGGANNWTNDNILPLITGLNRLEVYEDDVFKSNLLLTKKKVCSGVYLKWFNRSGGFSHYLFDKYFVSQTRSKEIGRVLNNEFLNIDEATGKSKSIGKEAVGNINIKAKFESEDYEVLKDIFTSPLVQMYTSNVAYVEGSFIDVFVDGSFSFANKRGKSEIALIVDLPEVITAKL